MALTAAALTVLLWASAFAGIRVSLTSYSAESVALLRYLTASFVLCVYAFITRMPLPERRDLPMIALLGFFGFSAYNVLLNLGEVGLSAGIASFIVASETIITAILATLFLNDRLNRWGWIGITVSLAGVAVISAAREQSVHIDGGVILLFIAALVKSVYSVGQKTLLKKYGALRFATYAIWAGTGFMLIFTPRLISELPLASTQATLAVLYLGIFPGAIGYVCWSFVLSKISPSIAATFLYFAPFLATFIAWLWIGEVPGLLIFAGGGLIVIGVVIVSRKGKTSVQPTISPNSSQ